MVLYGLEWCYVFWFGLVWDGMVVGLKQAVAGERNRSGGREQLSSRRASVDGGLFLIPNFRSPPEQALHERIL